jgi:hypothetical protein
VTQTNTTGGPDSAGLPKSSLGLLFRHTDLTNKEAQCLQPSRPSGPFQFKIVTCRGTDWMVRFIAPYTFTTRDCRQYSAIADLHYSQFTVTHALVFSVFTSRILATDFNSLTITTAHMESSFHSPTANSRDSLKSNSSQSQSYFTTGGLPPVISSWRKVP